MRTVTAEVMKMVDVALEEAHTMDNNREVEAKMSTFSWQQSGTNCDEIGISIVKFT